MKIPILCSQSKLTFNENKNRAELNMKECNLRFKNYIDRDDIQSNISQSNKAVFLFNLLKPNDIYIRGLEL